MRTTGSKAGNAEMKAYREAAQESAGARAACGGTGKFGTPTHRFGHQRGGRAGVLRFGYGYERLSQLVRAGGSHRKRSPRADPSCKGDGADGGQAAEAV